MPQDIRDGHIVCDRIAKVAPRHADRLAQHTLRAGDVVFSRRGDVSRFAVVTAAESGWLCGTGSIRIRLNCPDIYIPYARRYLQQDLVRGWLERNAKGLTMPNLNTAVIRALPFIYPPMAEQRRIADVLDMAEALRAKRRAAIAKLDALTQATFLALFGDPATNPRGWPIGRIGDLLLSATYGTSEKASASGDFAVLRMNNITRTGEMDFNELKYMDLDASEQDRYLVMQGDVLFNRTNSADLVGKTAIFREVQPMAYAGYLVRLRVNAENDPEYLACFLNTAYAKKMLRGMCKSIIGMANINAKEIQAMRIAQPPNDLQRKFARHVAAIGRLKAAHRASLVKLDNLFAALQHRAFRGEI
jgi:type I restriction enzyme S subunit